MSHPSSSKTKSLVWGLVVVLFIAHYDFWYWSDARLVFGFMPIGLFYQAWISIFAAVVWALAVRYAWPSQLEEWAEQGEDSSAEEGSE